MELNGDCGCNDNYYPLNGQSNSFGSINSMDPLGSNNNFNNNNFMGNNNNNNNNNQINNVQDILNNINGQSQNNSGSEIDKPIIFDRPKLNTNVDNNNIDNVKNILSNNMNNLQQNQPPLRLNNLPQVNSNTNVNLQQLPVNQNLQTLQNNNLNNLNNDKYYYNIFKNYNLVLVIIIALAWNDVAKFFINRAIKFNNLSANYYVYYALAATIILYGVSKYINNLNK